MSGVLLEKIWSSSTRVSQSIAGHDLSRMLQVADLALEETLIPDLRPMLDIAGNWLTRVKGSTSMLKGVGAPQTTPNRRLSWNPQDRNPHRIPRHSHEVL